MSEYSARTTPDDYVREFIEHLRDPSRTLYTEDRGPRGSLTSWGDAGKAAILERLAAERYLCDADGIIRQQDVYEDGSPARSVSEWPCPGCARCRPVSAHIKPLVWVETSKDSYSAKTPLAEYGLTRFVSTGGKYYWWRLGADPHPCETLDEAKAAAYTDLVECISSMLTEGPQTVCREGVTEGDGTKGSLATNGVAASIQSAKVDVAPADPVDVTPAPAPSIPEGWKLVPIEPTTEMVVAGTESWLCEAAMEDRGEVCYRAMLNASPAPGGTE